MKLELEKTFPMPGGSDTTWTFLQNIEGVAGCMPGARITERIDERHYKGTVSLKVGPASLTFKGDIEVVDIDAPNRTVHLVGKGSDSSGTSGASMDLVALVEAGDAPGASQLAGKSEVSVSGKAAAFGGRMMGSVTEQILQQFAANFADEVRRLAVAAGQPDAAAPSGAPAAEGPAATPRPSKELSALRLFWGVIRDWFRGLFGRSRSA